MLRKSAVILFGLLVLFAGCKKSSNSSPEPLSGSYEVVTEESLVSFTSIKNHDIPVGGTFDQVSGSINVKKDAPLNKTTGEINIKLGSLDTENDERDNNILTYFFRAIGDNVVSKEMNFSINKMKFREDVDTPLPLDRPAALTAIGKLSVFESTKKQKTQLTVIRLSEDRILVSTREPLAFEIDKYGMKKPLNKMMEICGHGAISNVVPAQFHLVFEKSDSSDSS